MKLAVPGPDLLRRRFAPGIYRAEVEVKAGKQGVLKLKQVAQQLLTRIAGEEKRAEPIEEEKQAA